MILRSPISGAALVPDTPHSLSAAGERWPVVDGIPYLRTGRETLAAEALAHLDAGCRDEALVAQLPENPEGLLKQFKKPKPGDAAEPPAEGDVPAQRRSDAGAKPAQAVPAPRP